jgi:hypothetical protein
MGEAGFGLSQREVVVELARVRSPGASVAYVILLGGDELGIRGERELKACDDRFQEDGCGDGVAGGELPFGYPGEDSFAISAQMQGESPTTCGGDQEKATGYCEEFRVILVLIVGAKAVVVAADEVEVA